MADVRPFRALRYDPGQVHLDRVICPPYDVLSPDEATKYWMADPHNALRLDAPLHDPGEEPETKPDETAAGRYARAAARLRRWQDEGVLVRDQRPAMYALEQRFTGPDGRRRTRRGFIARLRLEDPQTAHVRPHELTNRGPRHDRLLLLRATHTNLSQVFLLYPGAGDALQALDDGEDLRPAVYVRDQDGTEHRLRAVGGPAIEEAASLLSGRSLIIADGHHRYQTALDYRNERRALGDRTADWCMAYFCAMDDPGLTIFPAHRLIRGSEEIRAEEACSRLGRHFTVKDDWTDELVDPGPMLRRLAERATAPAFALLFPTERRAIIAELRDEEPLRRLVAGGMDPAVASLGVTVLHQVLLPLIAGVEPGSSEDVIDYFHQADEAFARLRCGTYSLGAFLNPPSLDDVRRVSAAGATMPHKSTYFFPKLWTGLVFNPLDEAD